MIDGGTVRLPRLVGQSRAMDMVLTGRAVGAEEALAMGLANRVVAEGTALVAAQELAGQLAEFPQTCMRSDRMSVLTQWGAADPLGSEFGFGQEALLGVQEGAGRFAAGAGRHGVFE